MLHIGPPVDQQLYHLVAALEAGQRQRRVTVGLDLGVDVAAHLQQQSVDVTQSMVLMNSTRAGIDEME